MPYSYPRATFTGAFGDNATGTWPPAQATIDQGYVTLWVMSQAGWVQRFSLPATQVTVKSAAQRITLVAGGQSFPILADPSAVNRALGWNAANIVGGAVGSTALDVGSAVGRGVNQFSAAQSFSAGGGAEFLAAARASGSPVSRLGYGAIAAIGCGGGALVVFMVVVITLFSLGL